MDNRNIRNLARSPWRTGFETMNTPMKIVMALLSLILMAGCAAFETTPADVHEKLTHPLNGHLYVPDSVDHSQKLAAY
jgi:hypothetical protein